MKSTPLPTDPPPYPTAGPVPEEWERACDQCGYNLTGLVQTTRCPECGCEFNPFQLPRARIPWLQRQRLGAPRAYLQTTLMLFLKPQVLSREVNRDVKLDLSDAERFSWYSARVVSGFSFILVASFSALMLLSTQVDFDSIVMTIAVLIIVPAVVFCIARMITFLPIMPSAAGSLRFSRLECLRHYASGACILIPLALTLLIAMQFQPVFPQRLMLVFLVISVPAVMYWVRVMLVLQLGKTPIRHWILSFVMFFVWWFIAGWAALFVTALILAGIESSLNR